MSLQVALIRQAAEGDRDLWAVQHRYKAECHIRKFGSLNTYCGKQNAIGRLWEVTPVPWTVLNDPGLCATCREEVRRIRVLV